jgi:hypothetical protein
MDEPITNPTEANDAAKPAASDGSSVIATSTGAEKPEDARCDLRRLLDEGRVADKIARVRKLRRRSGR